MELAAQPALHYENPSIHQDYKTQLAVLIPNNWMRSRPRAAETRLISKHAWPGGRKATHHQLAIRCADTRDGRKPIILQICKSNGHITFTNQCYMLEFQINQDTYGLVAPISQTNS